jgi:PhzF family phenazine biosynthesis protein
MLATATIEATLTPPHLPHPCLAGDGECHEFLSRFFAPWAGIAEDPVTGSAHSPLGTYWAGRLGRRQLRARQCSPRGGELLVTVRPDEGRVTVAGQAVTVFKGHLFLPKS